MLCLDAYRQAGVFIAEFVGAPVLSRPAHCEKTAETVLKTPMTLTVGRRWRTEWSDPDLSAAPEYSRAHHRSWRSLANAENQPTSNLGYGLGASCQRRVLKSRQSAALGSHAPLGILEWRPLPPSEPPSGRCRQRRPLRLHLRPPQCQGRRNRRCRLSH